MEELLGAEVCSNYLDVSYTEETAYGLVCVLLMPFKKLDSPCL